MVTAAASSPARAATVDEIPEQPNFVVIFCDDMGWGDLACYGHPTIATPNLDRMASEGTRLTQFYVSSSVCTPSRAGLITGRYPGRSGMYGNRRVLFPDSVGGLPDDELTIAEVLKSAGYTTAMAGKWHLGHRPEYLPTQHGFDHYFGIPYSNDMDKDAPKHVKGREVFANPNWRHFHVPLMQGSAGEDVETIERPTDQRTITQRYTYQTVDFIRQAGDQPFFAYLAHSMPHVPLFRSNAFVGHSRAGLYGDVIEEIDWSVGQILDELRRLDIEDETLVVFTSDNGPWLTFGDQGGSAGPLRNGKGTTFEGGMRVPGLVWMPGTIPENVVSAQLASTLDLLPTFAAMADAKLPEDLTLDGFDLSGMLVEQRPTPRQSMAYYRDSRLMAIRHGRHKAHFITQDSYVPGSGKATSHDPPLIYDLEIDLGEQRNLAKDNPQLVEQFQRLKAEQEKSMQFAESQLDRKP